MDRATPVLISMSHVVAEFVGAHVGQATGWDLSALRWGLHWLGGVYFFFHVLLQLHYPCLFSDVNSIYTLIVTTSSNSNVNA